MQKVFLDVTVIINIPFKKPSKYSELDRIVSVGYNWKFFSQNKSSSLLTREFP